MAIGLCHRLQCLLPDCNRLQYRQTALQPIAIWAANNNKQRVCVCVCFYYTPFSAKPEESPIYYRELGRI